MGDGFDLPTERASSVLPGWSEGEPKRSRAVAQRGNKAKAVAGRRKKAKAARSARKANR